jgi:RimJ/RimL family protein N-acetyltransferase
MHASPLTPSSLNVPVLETPRLILRGHKLEDLDAMVAIWNDPVVRKHFHGRPSAREDIWAQLLRHFGCWAALGYGMWAIEEKDTGDYVGAAGVFEVKRGIDRAFEGVPEAGWALASRVHGQGYATEAMGAALGWIDAHLGNPRLFCIITPGNVASIRVAGKCGFRSWGETTYKDEKTLIFVRESPERQSL